MGYSREFVKESRKLRYETLDAETIIRAKKCIIHQLACTCPTSVENWSRAAQSLVRDTSRGGEATVWFSDAMGTPFEATLANVVAGSSLIQEDIHREDGIHPGCMIVPVALAVGEAYALSGKAVIEAIVQGYQFLCRTGRAVVTDEFNRRGFRPTTIMGTFASAFTAGVLLGLNEDELVNAIGIAGNFSCGINEWAHTGVSEVYFQNGLAAASGIIAAEAAKRGVTGSETIFEGGMGACNAFGMSAELMAESIPNDEILEIHKVKFKGAPTCNFNQGAAALGLKAAADRVRPEDVEGGTIWTNSRSIAYPGVDYKGPFDTIMMAKMSQQYTFAALLTYGQPINEAFEDFHNETILTLVNKLDALQADTSYDKIYPARMQGRAELRLKDGSVRRYSVEEANFYSNEEVDDGFRHYFRKLFDEERVEDILRRINNLESLDNIREVCRLLGKKD